MVFKFFKLIIFYLPNNRLPTLPSNKARSGIMSGGASLSEIAKLLESVKGDLGKQISDQAINLENTFKLNVDRVVAPIIKRQEDYEVKNDERFKKLEVNSDGRFKNLEDSVANLTELVKGKNATHFPPLPSNLGHLQTTPSYRPPPPPPPSHPAEPSQSAEVTDPNNVTGKVIKELIDDARCVIGIGPMYQHHYEKFGDITNPETIRLAAIEAIRLELNVKDDEIAEDDIASTFLPTREPKIPRVYIRFHRQEHADLCLKLAKGLKDPDVKIFRYFPRQFLARVRALEEVAYSLRKASNPRYKTDVVYTASDVQLMVCPLGGARYHPYPVSDLPPIDTTPARSPPQGRARSKRIRSPDSIPSPSQENRKSSRHISPPKPAEGGDDDGIKDTEIEGAQAPVVAPPPTSVSDQTISLMSDTGGFSSMEVMSPRTGRLSFDFQQPRNLRRESLNC